MLLPKNFYNSAVAIRSTRMVNKPRINIMIGFNIRRCAF